MPYGGHYREVKGRKQRICDACGSREGRRVVKRYKHSPIGGKRGRNSGKVGTAGKKR